MRLRWHTYNNGGLLILVEVDKNGGYIRNRAAIYEIGQVHINPTKDTPSVIYTSEKSLEELKVELTDLVMEEL